MGSTKQTTIRLTDERQRLLVRLKGTESALNRDLSIIGPKPRAQQRFARRSADPPGGRTAREWGSV